MNDCERMPKKRSFMIADILEEKIEPKVIKENKENIEPWDYALKNVNLRKICSTNLFDDTKSSTWLTREPLADITRMFNRHNQSKFPILPWIKKAFPPDSPLNEKFRDNDASLTVGSATLKHLSESVTSSSVMKPEAMNFGFRFHFTPPRDQFTDIVTKKKKKKWVCKQCSKVFDRPSLLERHIRTHTGERPYECVGCDKKFSTSSSLNTHVRIHTGERPHVCDICSKRFTASSNLYYHRMTHTRDKPHKCALCPKSFPTPGDLRNHAPVHTGMWPLMCPCGRGFVKANNLRTHLMTHLGMKPFTCEICPRSFTVLCNLKAHMRNHHGIYEWNSAKADIAENDDLENLLNKVKERIKDSLFCPQSAKEY